MIIYTGTYISVVFFMMKKRVLLFFKYLKIVFLSDKYIWNVFAEWGCTVDPPGKIGEGLECPGDAR